MNGADIEKQRAEYVTSLELQVQHLQRQLNELQAKSNWIPEVSMVMDPKDGRARITLNVAGKMCSVALEADVLNSSDTTSITSAVLDSFYQNLLAGQYRPLIEMQVAKAQRGVTGIQKAGKW